VCFIQDIVIYNWNIKLLSLLKIQQLVILRQKLAR